MVDQMFETFRKASASILQMQQEMFKQWAQPMRSSPMGGAAAPTEWIQKLQKRWTIFMTQSFNTRRETLESMYRAGMQLIEQALRVPSSANPEDYRRALDDLRRRMFETFKEQSEVQLREFEKEAAQWLDLIPKPGEKTA